MQGFAFFLALGVLGVAAMWGAVRLLQVLVRWIVDRD